MDRLTRWNGKKFILPQGAGVWRTIAEKLAAYEEAEEKGTLLVLPATVGDPVFAHLSDSTKGRKLHDASECVITEIQISKDYKEPLFTAVDYEHAEYRTFWLSDFGKEIFTPEQYFSAQKKE